MITFTTSKTTEELVQIIRLQKENLPANLTPDEINRQGFVTVSHSLEDLQKMHEYERNLVIKDGARIVGYLLAMTKNSKLAIAILAPMFEIFNAISYELKTISDYNYLVVGQVCIDKAYRGMGLLDKAYACYKDLFASAYDFAITEIATSNLRSINAHRRIGFVEIHRYRDKNSIEWSIVLWDWGQFP